MDSAGPRLNGTNIKMTNSVKNFALCPKILVTLSLTLCSLEPIKTLMITNYQPVKQKDHQNQFVIVLLDNYVNGMMELAPILVNLNVKYREVHVLDS